MNRNYNVVLTRKFGFDPEKAKEGTSLFYKFIKEEFMKRQEMLALQSYSESGQKEFCPPYKQ